MLRDTPDSFRDYPNNGDDRTAGRVLAHIGDLMDWALSMLEGRTAWHDSEPLEWPREIERFYLAIAALDARIASAGLGHCAPERLFQGPLADAFTHTGQLAMMRRLAGIRMKGENTTSRRFPLEQWDLPKQRRAGNSDRAGHCALKAGFTRNSGWRGLRLRAHQTRYTVW